MSLETPNAFAEEENILLHTALFKQVSPAEAEELLPHLKHATFDKGDYIFSEGDTDQRMYLLEQGRVKLIRTSSDDRVQLLSIHAPGEVLGEIPVFDPHGGPRTASAVSMSHGTRVVWLEHDALFAWLDEHPRVAIDMLQVMASRQRGNNERISDLVFTLTLLYALSGIRSFYPVPFELVAIAVDLGYEDFDLSPVKALCDELSVEFYVVKTDIGRISLEKSKNQASPCSWCAKLRKGALNDFALSVGCNKVAYAHHMDDIIETMFLSLLYEGQFYSFAPVTQLDGSGLAIIRPLMYVGESDVKGFKNKYNLPVCKNPCPYDGHTRREYVKQLVRQLNMENPGVKKRLFSAIQNGNIDDWHIISGSFSPRPLERWMVYFFSPISSRNAVFSGSVYAK